MNFLFAGKLSAQWLFAGLSLCAITSLLTLLLNINGRELLGSSNHLAENNPPRYDELDAIEACRVHSKERFEDKLFRSTVDSHSTRFDESRGVYLIVLNGHIGNMREYDDAIIYCYIRPDSNRVTYFRSYDSDTKSLQSGTGFAFFKSYFK